MTFKSDSANEVVWTFEPFTEKEIELGSVFASAFDLNPVVGQLMARRGIGTIDEASSFLYPSIQDLHDPFLMKDMKEAVERLNLALGRKETILVYGDYDVDGTTAVALVYKYLRHCGCSEKNLFVYIPDRYDEGYGISLRGIDYAKSVDAKLIIALDCGIKAIKQVDYAKSLGIDFIICDHHKPDAELPNALAILDTKREDNTYPFDHLSGCGVGFKLMQAFAISNGFRLQNLYRHLDLLAISIAADIVPVVGENRVLAYYGLKQLNNTPCIGLQCIMRQVSLDSTLVTMEDIIFKIGPRLNASGRMMNGKESVALLLAKTEKEGERVANIVAEYNEQRRELDKLITDEAISMVEQDLCASIGDKIIVLYKSSWHKGVIGIIASRIAERFNRPAIVLSGSGKNISGSARSVDGFDVYAAIESCKDLLLNFGGHSYASGLSLKSEDVFDEFCSRIKAFAKTEIRSEQTSHRINISADIKLSEISRKFYRDIRRMAPFGSQNEKPIFMTRNVISGGGSRIVGHDSEHLKIDCLQANSKSKRGVVAIAFNQASAENIIKESPTFSICYTLEENNFSGKKNIQLFVKDIQPEP